MILATGLHGNAAGRTPKPPKVKMPTPGQSRCVTAWATRPLAGATLRELQTAQRVLAAHPDAERPGYSRAKSTLARLTAELATRS